MVGEERPVDRLDAHLEEGYDLVQPAFDRVARNQGTYRDRSRVRTTLRDLERVRTGSIGSTSDADLLTEQEREQGDTVRTGAYVTGDRRNAYVNASPTDPERRGQRISLHHRVTSRFGRHTTVTGATPEVGEYGYGVDSTIVGSVVLRVQVKPK